MASYKLNYFNLAGRGEVIRWVFELGGVKYIDNRFEFADWPKIKAEKSPLGSAPWLEITENGQTWKLGQTATIARYAASKANLLGKSDKDRALGDAYGDEVSDLTNKLAAAFVESDPTRKAELEKKIGEEVWPAYLKKFEDRLTENGTGVLVGKDLTWTDLYWVSVVGWAQGKLDPLLEKFPKNKALIKKVTSEPKISNYIKAHKK